jgi:flavin reductase (DIM6/NTAB) family NADH-FMN oxidoreductase RutF
MFKQIPNAEFYHLINHGPCVLITSGDGKKNNVAPIAWSTPINDSPALVGIALADSHYTTELILKSGEFVVNVPDVSLLPALKIAGGVSGRKANKFEKAGITPLNGVKTRVPHIKECIGFIECKVIDKSKYDGVTFFVGKVVYCSAEKGLYNKVWKEKAKTVHHMGGSVFAVTGKRV